MPSTNSVGAPVTPFFRPSSRSDITRADTASLASSCSNRSRSRPASRASSISSAGPIVDREDASLSRRRLCSATRDLGTWIRALVREVAIRIDEAIAERVPHTLHHLAQATAVRAEKVLVTDDDDAVVRQRTAHVI